MRWFSSFVLLVFGLAQWAVAQTAESDDLFDQAEYQARMAEVIGALLSSENVEQQAAGLMLTRYLHWAEWPREQSLLSETELSARGLALIESADTAVARALLAQLCANRQMRSDCVDRGLDDAIVRFDGANLLARMQLTSSDDTARLRDIIVESRSLNEHHMDYALLLLDAMEQHGGFQGVHFALPVVFSLTLMPSYQGFTRLCGPLSFEDSELDQACEQTLQLMMDDPSSVILAMIASATTAERRYAQGQSDARDIHEQWRLEFRNWSNCTAESSNLIFENADTGMIREKLEHWQQHGEASAFAMISRKAGHDCGTLSPPPFRTAKAD